jgi:hypothetical protein
MRTQRQHIPVLIFFLLIACQVFAQADGPYIQPEKAGDPVADPRAVVVVGNARFTVLTPQLIRMEWAADRKFEDHASFVFINRHLPAPHFQVHRSGGVTILETEKLKLRYRRSGRFNAENLSISFLLNGNTVTWKPGMPDIGNLGGTLRTLDGVKGSTQLEPGLLSRDGWVVVDDSARPLFDRSDWPWAMPRPTGARLDWYFFGYGLITSRRSMTTSGLPGGFLCRRVSRSGPGGHATGLTRTANFESWCSDFRAIRRPWMCWSLIWTGIPLSARSGA